MRAIVIGEDRALELRDLPDADPGEGQVRVRVEACGICGSDLHMRPSEAVPAGAVMGHELAGSVETVGAGVEAWSAGDRVCVYPFQPMERHDLDVALATGLGLGGVPGGFAESVTVDQSMLWRLPDRLATDHATLVEPLAVALHGLNVGGVREDDACVVIGAGPIGVVVSLALRARGIERVVVVERNGRRRARIKDLGFPSVGLDDLPDAAAAALGGVAPSLVIECAGSPAAPGLAVELVAPSGRIVLLGVLEEPVTFSQLQLMLKEGEIRASFAYRPGDFDEAVALLATGRIPAERLITGREPLERADDMFRALADPATDHIKVLLRP